MQSAAHTDSPESSVGIWHIPGTIIMFVTFYLYELIKTAVLTSYGYYHNIVNQALVMFLKLM